jgi:hypothetical protein
MCPFQIWAKSRQTKGIAAGESPLKLLQGDHTFATFACKHSEKTAICRRNRVAGGSSPDVSGGKPARPASDKDPLFSIFDPEISGGLFLDSGLSRLKMGATSNCGVVSAVVSFPPSPPSPQIPRQFVLGLVSIPEVPHAVVSPAVHRPHMCRRHEANAATSVRRRADAPGSVDGP